MYSIPLRRALVTQSDLPYPEGVACAEVLKVGGGEHADAAAVEESRAGLRAVIWGSIVSAAFALIVATRIFASDVVRYFRVGERGVTGFDFFLSFALFGVGHLVGLWVGIAMLVGALIGWVLGRAAFLGAAPATGATPIAHLAQAHLEPQGALRRRRHHRRGGGVDAGEAGQAGDRRAALGDGAPRARARPARPRCCRAPSRTSRSAGSALVSLLCMLPIGFLLAHFAHSSGLGDHLVLAGGGRRALHRDHELPRLRGVRLHGRPDRLLQQPAVGHRHPGRDRRGAAAGVRRAARTSPPDGEQALVAFALFVTAVVFAVAAIANNNLQDLKTGQLVDATPWKQQVALVIGVIAGAAIIPPILDLLNHAYGFAGAPGPHHEHPLPAPQAGLISALAQGVIQNNVDWSLIEIGGVIGVVIIIVDELLRRLTTGAHLSPLAVGLGIYLPTQSTLMVVVGAVAGWYYDRRAERARQARGDQAARRAARLGHDRRRGADRRADRRARRLLRQGFPAGAGGRRRSPTTPRCGSAAPPSRW